MPNDTDLCEETEGNWEGVKGDTRAASPPASLQGLFCREENPTLIAPLAAGDAGKGEHCSVHWRLLSPPHFSCPRLTHIHGEARPLMQAHWGHHPVWEKTLRAGGMSQRLLPQNPFSSPA